MSEVTICLPVYNAELYLDETIQSVLAQSYSDWQMLISDNASTDRSIDIAKAYPDPRIHIHKQSDNKGVSRNWQFLFERVKTPYFCILGADDIFQPNHLRQKLGLLKHDAEAPYAHGAVNFIDSQGLPLPKVDFECAEVEGRDVTLPRFLKVNFANTTSILYRTEALRRFNLGFEERYPIIMDWALELKSAMRYDHILYDKEPTVKYRIHAKGIAQISVQTFQWTYETLAVRLDALREYPKVWRDIGIDPEREAQRLSQPLWTVFIQQMRYGNRKNAWLIWKLFRSHHSLLSIPLDLPRYASQLWRKHFPL